MPEAEVAVEEAPVVEADAEKPAVETETPPPESAEKPTEESPTLAGGGEAVTTPVTTTFPEDWAKQLAGDDPKALKKFERFKGMPEMAKAYLAADAQLASGLVKIPDAEASDEDRAAFNKARGVPEVAESYVDNAKLTNDRTLGDDDKTVARSFAEVMHGTGLTPDQFNAAVSWKMDLDQAIVEQEAEADSEFRIQSEVDLKQKFGGDFKRMTNAIPTLFANSKPEVMDLLLSARAADGRKLGDHPDIVEFLADKATELNPAAPMGAVDGDNMKSLQDRIDEISTFQKQHSEEYFNTPKGKRMAEEKASLLEMQERANARAA